MDFLPYDYWYGFIEEFLAILKLACCFWVWGFCWAAGKTALEMLNKVW